MLDSVSSLVRLKPIERDRTERRLAKCGSIADVRKIAKRELPSGVFDYIDGGAEDEVSLSGDGRIPLICDGGIRRGSDIVKALALGANAVMVGRPYLYGLAAGGQRGVEWVLEDLVSGLQRTMALCGRRSVSELTRDLVVLDIK